MGHADALMRMARLHAQQGRKGEASRLLEAAISTGGDSIRQAASKDPDLKAML